MTTYHIAALPGDGIGPEVMEATLRVLEHAVSTDDDLKLDVRVHEAGVALYQRTGTAIPDDVMSDCLAADAVLLAAMGLTDVRRPDGTEVQPEIVVGLRRKLELFAAVRPIKLYPGVPSPLTMAEDGIDFVVLRENLEGLFASFGGGSMVGEDVATDTMVITREGTRRIVDFAFNLARRRNGRPSDGQKTVTCVDKANVFRSLALFRNVFHDVAAGYPDVHAEAVHVDAMTMFMVQQPSAFDVLVMENMFGDILSDLGAGLVGGLGMAPSAEIGSRHALFQPSHGSAPQIMGQNVANPIATILSASMMLDWLGERDGNAAATRAGRRIEDAVAAVIAGGRVLTQDLGGTARTNDVADAIAAAL